MATLMVIILKYLNIDLNSLNLSFAIVFGFILDFFLILFLSQYFSYL